MDLQFCCTPSENCSSTGPEGIKMTRILNHNRHSIFLGVLAKHNKAERQFSKEMRIPNRYRLPKLLKEAAAVAC